MVQTVFYYSFIVYSTNNTNVVKASAHSFKRFTSWLLKLSFSLSFYAPITWDECHALFHLNAASPVARNTEQVNIKKVLSTVGFDPPTTRPPDYKSTFSPLVKFQLNMSKHVREKCGILSVSSILSYKVGITPTESDGN